MKLQNLLLVVLACAHLSSADELSREEYAALKIQTAFRASQARRQIQEDLQLDKFQTTYLNPIPYQELRDLICSGNYLNRTDLLGHFVHITRKETINFPKQLIDPEFHNRFDLSTMQLYKKAWTLHFQQRAIHEIKTNKMSWTEAVSMPNPDIKIKQRVPLTATYQNTCTPPQTHLVIANIFNAFVDQLLPIALPILHAKSIKEKRYDNDSTSEMVGIISIFGSDYASPINPHQDDASWVQAMINPTLGYYFDGYFKLLGTPSHLKNQEIQENQINWTFAAHTVFYLGQFFFENKTDALTALGGQKWIKQQPEDIQEIINTHLNNIQPQSWLTRMTNALAQYTDYAKKEARNYLKK